MRGRVLGEGAATPYPPAEGLQIAVSSPSRSRAECFNQIVIEQHCETMAEQLDLF